MRRPPTRIAATCSGQASTSVTAAPASANAPPRLPPIAPAPMTAIRQAEGIMKRGSGGRAMSPEQRLGTHRAAPAPAYLSGREHRRVGGVALGEERRAGANGVADAWLLGRSLDAARDRGQAGADAVFRDLPA